MLYFLIHFTLNHCITPEDAAETVMQDIIAALQAENYAEMQNFDVQFMFIKQNKLDLVNQSLDKAKKELIDMFDDFDSKLKGLYDFIREVGGLMGIPDSNLKDRLTNSARPVRRTEGFRAERAGRNTRGGYQSRFRRDERIPGMNLTPLSFNK